jgi:phosphatidylserine/phosphatidylglycerophosphate/cardiolipin synthase-like enzyme
LIKYITRYLIVGIIGTVLMSYIRSGYLKHVFDSTPSFSSLHIPEMSNTVSAAITSTTGRFHYTPEENNEDLDLDAISRMTRGHLDIAMYAFTDHALADAVAQAAGRGVQVRIYRDAQQYEEEQRRDTYVARDLARPGISIRVKSGRELMHLKEWSDGERVRERSSNWSVSGEKYQDNSAAIFVDKPAADAFEEKFEEMWDRPNNLRVQ